MHTLFIALTLLFQDIPAHDHDVTRLKTWENMRAVPGKVVFVSKEQITLYSADKYVAQTKDYFLAKTTSKLRMPRKGETIILFYCPHDFYVYAILTDNGNGKGKGSWQVVYWLNITERIKQ